MPIDQRLLDTSFVIGNTSFSTVLLKNDSRFFWVMIVPHNDSYSEIFEIPDENYHFFMDEIKNIAHVIKAYTGAIKMNIETIGNIVPMLHMHIIARFENDCCWPRPIWVADGDAIPYDLDDANVRINDLKRLLKL